MTKNDSKLLIDEYPLHVLPTLAEKIGLNEAIVLQQIHYWLKISEKSKDDRKRIDGRWWTYNTLDEWQKNFPFWSLSTIRRTIKNLEEMSLVLSFKKEASDWDHTKWYSIDYSELFDLSILNKSIRPNGTDRSVQDEQNLNMYSDPSSDLSTEVGRRAAIVQELSEMLGGSLNPRTADTVNDWLSDYPFGWIMDAIEISKNNNARSAAYATKILDGWLENGRGNKKPGRNNGRKQQTRDDILAILEENDDGIF